MNSRFIRLAEQPRDTVQIRLDGQSLEVFQGDTLMSAVLSHQSFLRPNEFDQQHRAGFCLMGACQDCWVWTRDGQRLRACTTYVEADMDIVTRQPEDTWPVHELS
jgi:predicted molibdopterin-dependent oxidoreductase YjgC